MHANARISDIKNSQSYARFWRFSDERLVPYIKIDPDDPP